MRVSRLLGATLRVRREKKAGVVIGVAAAEAELPLPLLLLLLETIAAAGGAATDATAADAG
jgi:hypothetical protein